MKPVSQKILWVDDCIENLSFYVKALRSEGLDVLTASSTIEGLALAREHTFGVILADIKMPAPDGIEFLRKVHPIQPSARLAALSSYLYLQRYRDQLKNLGFDVEIIDKDFPSTDDPHFRERFLGPIIDLVKRGAMNTLKIIEQREDALTGTDPFSIEFQEFMKLTYVEKDKLVDRAEEMASETIKRAFKEGKIWVLLCGDKSTIRASASENIDILPEKEVLEYAMGLNRAPYLFFRGVTAEDIRWTGCGDEFSLKNYPTVTLRIKNRSEPRLHNDLTVHFDTGSPDTFFSYEELISISAIPDAVQFGKITINGQEERCASIRVPAVIRCQATGMTRDILLLGNAIREWVTCALARNCGDKCTNTPTGQVEQLCPERKGLVGRNLLIDNSLSLVLDGKERKTRLEAAH